MANQSPKIKFTIITLFQEALESYLNVSMMWKAQDKGIAEFNFVNLREFGLGPHRSVDDTPYGGGDGMLLRCEPVYNAIESVKAKDPDAKVILPTPVGKIWNQQMAKEFAGTVVEQSLRGDSGAWQGEDERRPPVATGRPDAAPMVCFFVISCAIIST